MKRISIFYVLIALITWSCQDVVDIETTDLTRSLNVYGLVSDSAGTVVNLSITTSYFDQNDVPYINDADVFLYEDDVVVGQILSSGNAGQYFLNFNGEVGKAYHIEVILPSSYNLPETWQSTPEVMARIFTPDSFSSRYLDRTTNPSVFDEGYYGILYFKEPNGVGDNYRIRRWLNDSLFGQELFIFDDQNFDGADFGGVFPGFNVYGPMEIGDSLKLEISSVTSQYYDFLSLINEQVFQIGGPFDPPPSPIIGNLYNVNDPEEFGYGFFSATAQNTTSLIVKP